jgi:hypothetical protein
MDPSFQDFFFFKIKKYLKFWKFILISKIWRISPTILANLVELTLEKQKLPKKFQFFGYEKKKSVKLKHCVLLSENPLTFG